MYQYTVHVCGVCGNKSIDREDIELCEAKHIGLYTLGEYHTYLAMVNYAKYCTAKLNGQSNQKLRDAETKAYNALLAFEKKHNMTV